MSTTTLWTDQLVEASNFTVINGEEVALLTSATIANSGGSFNAAKIDIQFEDFTSASGDLSTGSIYILVQEEVTSGVWKEVPAYQGNPLKKGDQAPQRVLILQPNFTVLNLGETDVVKRNNVAISETNRHAIPLPENPVRIVIALVENNVGGANAFESVKVSGYIERYTI